MRSTIDGQPLYACPTCTDTGLVTVWSPVLVAWVEQRWPDGDVPDMWHEDPQTVEARHVPTCKPSWSRYKLKLPADTCVVACTCDAGTKYRNQTKGEQSKRSVYVTYDKDRYCLYRSGDAREVVEWLNQQSAPVAWTGDDGGYSRYT